MQLHRNKNSLSCFYAKQDDKMNGNIPPEILFGMQLNNFLELFAENIYFKVFGINIEF